MDSENDLEGKIISNLKQSEDSKWKGLMFYLIKFIELFDSSNYVAV